MADEVLHDTGHASPDNKKFARGAKPTPKHVIAASEPFVPLPTLFAPTQFAVVPPKLSMWYNDRFGICVSAQEAFAKAAYSVQIGLPELFIPDAEVLRWATKYGFRDGANLDEVMKQMSIDGFTVNGVNYHDGGYKSVDYTNDSVLQAAILQGPVNIAIDANALSSSAGNVQGWYSTGGSPGQYPNTDHCVALSSFGPAEFLYQALNVPMPSALAGKSGYLLFTWSTIGFVDRAWLLSTCVEAWVRNPTTPEQVPAPTPPVPPVPPTPPTPVPPPPAHVDIPALAVKLFGFTIASTIPTTVPVVYQTIGVNWGNLFKDTLKLAQDVAAGNWLSIPGDIAAIYADLRSATRLGAVNWTQLWPDLMKLWTDYSANAPVQTVWVDFWAVVADLGL